ncbi:methylamine utilization protein MauJ [Maridesulfovibrio sp.]|uniref:methylamine utilization protein MauJ n=1 Tax=Maridesulfovibrio sp. TaxID=2795000 RepID=UPI003AFFFDAD
MSKKNKKSKKKNKTKQNKPKFLSLEDVSKKTNLPQSWVVGLTRAGLLGFSRNGKISEKAFNEFASFGTQWGDHFPNRYMPAGQFPVVESIGPQPADTLTHIQVGQDKDFEKYTTTGYLAQFYLKPNYKYFQPPYEAAYTEGAMIHLGNKVNMVFDEGVAATLYPGPNKLLCLVSFYWSKIDGLSIDDVYQKSSSYLNEITEYVAVIHDTPVSPANSLIIEIPSGVVNIYTKKISEIRHLDLTGFEFYINRPDCHSCFSLYREALMSNHPLAKFNALWRCNESVDHAIANFRKEFKTFSIKYAEVIPATFAYGTYQNISFKAAINKIRPIRNAINHADFKKEEPITLHDPVETDKIEGLIPILRYIVRAKLCNYTENTNSIKDVQK